MQATTDRSNLIELAAALDGQVKRDVPLAPFTTFKIGGPADLLLVVHSSAELARAVSLARSHKVDHMVLGTGANVLVGDRGFRGLVIKNEARDIVWLADDLVRADSGVVMADLIESARERGCSGLEHFAGIPSSVGGALWQNLHFLAPDRKRTVYVSEVLEQASILTADGEERQVDVDYFEFGYDDSILHHRCDVALNATFRLSRGDLIELGQVIAANIQWRQEHHPDLKAFASAGSVFKKIRGVGAGRLVDQCGLKGFVVGGAQISPRHANFIVNLGGAKARDVLALAAICRERVRALSGFELEMEIGVVGEL